MSSKPITFQSRESHSQGAPSHPHFIVSVAWGPELSRAQSLTELCGLRVSMESYVAPKGPLQCQRCQRFGHTQRNCGYAPTWVARGGSHPFGGCSTPLVQPKCCVCGGNHSAKYCGCNKWKEARAALAKQAPERCQKSSATDHPIASKPRRAGSSAEHMTWARGWITSSEVGVFRRPAQLQNPNQIPRRLNWPPQIDSGSGIATLVRCGIVDHSLSVPGLTHLEATAIQITLSSIPVIILAPYPLPYCPPIGVDLTACFRGGLPVLISGDLNAEHMDWNSRLSMRREKLLRNYADENSCLIFGPDSSNSNPYTPSASPDFLGIATIKNLSFQVYLTLCSAISSDHLLVLIDTACHSSFHHPPDHPDFRRTEWANFQTHLEDPIQFDPELHNQMAIETWAENLSDAILKDLAASIPRSTALRPTASDSSWYLGRDKPEEPGAADHQGPRSESSSQMPEEVGDPGAQRVEEQPVECDTPISRSRRPINVEGDKTGDESAYSTFPTGHPGGIRSQTLRKPKPLPICRLSFSRWPILQSWQLR